MFFIGSLMHFNDSKLSSGGFIHGFRYLIDLFFKINFTKFEFLALNFNSVFDVNLIVRIITDRINTSSELYQMFGIIVDIFYYDIENKRITYVKNTKKSLISDKIVSQIYFMLSLEYGTAKLKKIDELGFKYSNIGSEALSTLLHPVISSYNSSNDTPIDVVHLDEDLLAEFTNHSLYHDRIFRLFKSYLI
jgi:hypothetical protein